MSSLILTANTAAELRPSPIEPSWIISGDPKASNAVLSRSEDGTASTIVWHCTEGMFNWYYDIDETIHILEGAIVLESDTMKPTRFAAGDVVFFKKGAQLAGAWTDTSGRSLSADARSLGWWEWRCAWPQS